VKISKGRSAAFVMGDASKNEAACAWPFCISAVFVSVMDARHAQAAINKRVSAGLSSRCLPGWGCSSAALAVQNAIKPHSPRRFVMDAQRWMWTAWPAFLAAAVMEMVVFAFVDPLDVHWLGSPLEWSRSAIYTVAFFAFWLVMLLCSAMTRMLARSIQDLNGGVVSEPLAD
jgi:hypothetical protein